MCLQKSKVVVRIEVTLPNPDDSLAVMMYVFDNREDALAAVRKAIMDGSAATLDYAVYEQLADRSFKRLDGDYSTWGAAVKDALDLNKERKNGNQKPK